MLSAESLERVFDQLARAIDDVGPAHEGLFLTKLAFVLANRLGDEDTVGESIALAREHLGSIIAPAKETIAIKGLHHFAWRCKDAEETRHFYEDLLGLPLAHVIKSEVVPSTGEHCPYIHIFFRMADGSYIAFFDLGDHSAAEPSPNTPSWVNHIALELGSVGEVEAVKQRLKQAGVPVIGVTDHHIIQSIYFFDPNGLRVELTARSVPARYMDEAEKRARAELDAWTREQQWKQAHL